jgi:hypothetical protein
MGVVERNVLEGVEIHRPVLKEAVKKACCEALDIFESDSISDINDVLFSQRRVHKVLDGSYSVSTPRFSKNSVLGLIPDIQYDLASFMNIDIDRVEIARHLASITQLETAFYKVGEVKAMILPWEVNRNICDINELTSLSRNLVERSVWFRWTPGSLVDPFVAMKSLRLAVMGYLKNLRFFAYDSVFSKGALSLDDIRLKERLLWEVQLRRTKMKESEAVYLGSVDDWYVIISSLSLRQVFYFIEKLEDREKRALLDRFRYLHPDMKLDDRFKLYGISRTSYYSDVRRAIRSLGVLMEKKGELTGNESPASDIVDIVGEVENSALYRFEEGYLRIEAGRSRRILLERRQDRNFLKKLTDQERWILCFITTLGKKGFLFSTRDIADICGLSISRVSLVVQKLAEMTPERERFINREGKEIFSSTIQYELIKIRPSIPQKHLSALYWKDRVIFDALTCPNNFGRYQSVAQVEKQTGFAVDSKLRNIWESLLNCYWILDLENDIQLAINEYEDCFSKDEVRVMYYVLEAISAGFPLRSKGGMTKIGWGRICKKLEVPEHFGIKITRKLRKIKIS